MSEEFNLSDKRSKIFDNDKPKTPDYQYHEEDVKEFIRLLKEELGFNVREDDEIIPVFAIKKIIDKLAGEKLR